jgi:hypothetical protein
MESFAVKPGPWKYGTKGDRGDGNPIQVNGKASPRGLGLHPPDAPGAASASYRPGKRAATLRTTVALNDSATIVFSAAVFEVWGDGKRLWQSQPIKQPRRPQEARVDVTGVDVLELRVRSEGSHFGLHAVWLDPCLLPPAD